MGWKAIREEWHARRVGRRAIESDLPRSAREVIGPTGWMWSSGWDVMAENARAYVNSFEPKVPPSLFVSERDRRRYNIPIPVSERMLERHAWPDDPHASLPESDGP